MKSPGDRGACTSTIEESVSLTVVSSMGTTQSAPRGTGAPVMILQASSSSTSGPGPSPACTAPTTVSRAGESGPAPATSAERTAYPSICELTNSGRSTDARNAAESTESAHAASGRCVLRAARSRTGSRCARRSSRYSAGDGRLGLSGREVMSPP